MRRRELELLVRAFLCGETSVSVRLVSSTHSSPEQHSSQSSHGPLPTQETQILEDNHKLRGLSARGEAGGGEDQGGATAPVPPVPPGPPAVLQIPPQIPPSTPPGLLSSGKLV